MYPIFFHFVYPVYRKKNFAQHNVSQKKTLRSTMYLGKKAKVQANRPASKVPKFFVEKFSLSIYQCTVVCCGTAAAMCCIIICSAYHWNVHSIKFGVDDNPVATEI